MTIDAMTAIVAMIGATDDLDKNLPQKVFDQSRGALEGPQMEPPAAPMKYVLVTGGVLSSVGKGIVSSSLGVLLKSSGLRVTSIKIDPYLNIDAGTMVHTCRGGL